MIDIIAKSNKIAKICRLAFMKHIITLNQNSRWQAVISMNEQVGIDLFIKKEQDYTKSTKGN